MTARWGGEFVRVVCLCAHQREAISACSKLARTKDAESKQLQPTTTEVASIFGIFPLRMNENTEECTRKACSKLWESFVSAVMVFLPGGVQGFVVSTKQQILVWWVCMLSVSCKLAACMRAYACACTQMHAHTALCTWIQSLPVCILARMNSKVRM